MGKESAIIPNMKPFLTILLALSIDLIWGDPPNRFHPVVLMGRWLSWGRQLAPDRHRFGFGALWTLLGAALFALPWRLLQPTPIRTPPRPNVMKLSPPGPPQFKGGQG
ncbi:MAG: cobalamin biosynthesis protein, partial [Anaerolineae bacterium]|nr:cobalamin biosynthesis protein [Anaerolineae bacterium]